MYYLKYTNKGDEDKAGSKYWVSWSTDKAEVVLDIDSSGDTPTGYLRDTGKDNSGVIAYGAVKNKGGDKEFQCGKRTSNDKNGVTWKCPWVSLTEGKGDKLEFVNAYG